MKAMDRRTVLRGLLGGAAVTLPLPTLEIMLDASGEAFAGGDPLPTRFGVWFWGNGIKPDSWIPPFEGADWTPSAELQPLADLRSYVSVLTGMEIKTDDHPHHSGMAGIMTGRKYEKLGDIRDTIVSTFASQSVDQLAADWHSGTTPFRSIEAGVTWFRGTDEGSTFQHLSHNGPNNPNPSEYDPIALYERLFATETDPSRDLLRRSVLDAVNDQARVLNERLGAADRIRLEQYYDSVRTLEHRLAMAGPPCGTSAAPGSSYLDIGGLEQIEEKNLAMAQLVATALACDLTRVFSVLFSPAGSEVLIWQVGASDPLHTLSHEEPQPQPTVDAAITFTMEQLAVFLETLRDTPDGTGNLLDRCSILCTSELSDGYDHRNDEFPILIAGLGDGRLRGNYHYRSSSSRNTSEAVLTALHGGGVELGSFGADEGYADAVIDDVLT